MLSDSWMDKLRTLMTWINWHNMHPRLFLPIPTKKGQQKIQSGYLQEKDLENPHQHASKIIRGAVRNSAPCNNVQGWRARSVWSMPWIIFPNLGDNKLVVSPWPLSLTAVVTPNPTTRSSWYWSKCSNGILKMHLINFYDPHLKRLGKKHLTSRFHEVSIWDLSFTHSPYLYIS